MRPEKKDSLGRIALELGVVDPPYHRRNLGENVCSPRDYEGEPFLVFARWPFQINWFLLRAIEGEEIVGQHGICSAAGRAGKRLECPLQLAAGEGGVLGLEDPQALRILASDEQLARCYRLVSLVSLSGSFSPGTYDLLEPEPHLRIGNTAFDNVKHKVIDREVERIGFERIPGRVMEHFERDVTDECPAMVLFDGYLFDAVPFRERGPQPLVAEPLEGGSTEAALTSGRWSKAGIAVVVWLMATS